MKLHIGLGLFSLSFALLAGPGAAAASVPLPPPEVHCAGLLGECSIDGTPQDFLSCECTDGTTDGLIGGSAWADLSNEELLALCEQELESRCSASPPPPPPPVLECISRLGQCTITAAPTDHLECTCSDGGNFTEGGGDEWAGLSDEELLMVCEQELATGCANGAETGDDDGGGDSDGGDSDGGASTDGGDSDGGDSDDGGETNGQGSTSGSSDTSEPGGSDDDGGGSTSMTTTGLQPGSTGDDAGGTTEGSDGEDGSGQGSGGGGCSIAPGSRTDASRTSGFALMLLGMLAAIRRRHRAA